MKNIERLAWDSKVFGYEVGKINLDLIDDYDADRFFKGAKDYKLVYIFSKNRIEEEYFKLVDEKVTLRRSIEEINIPNATENNLESFRLSVDSKDELKELALKSGVFSRFYVDNNFVNNEYNKLYSLWIEKSVEEKLSFDIIVSKKNSIQGFITIGQISKYLSNIGLIAVSEGARGQGLGKALVLEAILRSKQKGFVEIEVVTQKRNHIAMNLYETLNFKIKESINIYHYWNI